MRTSVAALRAAGCFDPVYTERWAAHMGRADALGRTLVRADELERNT